jgi:phospholipid/cholesterol/gamma-HCH transport system substrate-binding protein
MLRRTTKIQLVLFLIITLVGVSYVGAEYVGITKGLFGSNACTVSADFPDSGGVFTNAEVTYRGVTVGRVGTLHIIPDGVRVDLKLDSCKNPKIPASTAAIVADRSVIGEQYVNLVPPNGNGPFLTSHQIIPMSRNSIPTATQTLLLNLDHMVKSINISDLQTTVSQLGAAFNNQGDNLGRLIDAQDALITTAQENLPETLALINAAAPVLQTQLDESSALSSFTHSLNLLSAQLKASDGDIRSLLDNGPTDLATLSSFVNDNRTDLGVTLANLATVGDLLVRHRDGIEEILELYPALASGGLFVDHPNGTGYLGFVLNANDPPDCGDPAKGSEGYNGTKIRGAGDLSPQAPNMAAHCATSKNNVNVRGSANVPGGDPIAVNSDGRAYPRGTTDSTVRIGSIGGQGKSLSDQSWIAVLMNGLY